MALELNAEGIGTSVHYPVALSLSNFYFDKYPCSSDEFPNANALAKQTISIPCGPHLNANDVDYIIKMKIVMSS